MAARHARRKSTGRRRAQVALAVTAALLMSRLSPAMAAGNTVTAAFSGGTGTATTGSVLFARSGAALTLTVSAPSDTNCVQVSGAFNATDSAGGPKASWSFATTGAINDGPTTVTVDAFANVNKN